METQARRAPQRLGHVLNRVILGYPVWGLIRASCLRKTRLNVAVCYWDVLLLAELSLHGEILEIGEVLSQQRSHQGNAVAICSLEQGAEINDRPDKANKQTRMALQRWTDPSAATKRIWLPLHEERCLEYLKRVYCSPLGSWEKVLCYLVVTPRLLLASCPKFRRRSKADNTRANTRIKRFIAVVKTADE